MADIPALPSFPPIAEEWLFGGGARLKVGMDLVQISRIQDSLGRFGERFLKRVFTEEEAAYARSTAVLTAERLAARFAAKEAALKALDMADKGIAWRDMEVCRMPDGRCELRLHAGAAAHARRHRVAQLTLSLTHDGDYAAAIVAAVCMDPCAKEAAASSNPSQADRPH